MMVDLLKSWQWSIYLGADDKPFALCDVDVMKYPDLRWTYTVMIEIYPTALGVDNKGSRASGSAKPAVISNPPTVHQIHPLVNMGDVIRTPFGDYQVDWYSKTNHDHLTLKEIHNDTAH